MGDGDIIKELHRTIQFSNPDRRDKSEVEKKYLELGLHREPETGAVAQLARAPALQAGCRGFEPHQLHHTTSRWRDEMNREGV